MPMTKDQIVKLVQTHGGEDNIYSVINDAGSVIKLGHMDAETIVFDWEANALKYPAWVDGNPVLITLSLDSLANIIFYDTENFDQLKKAIEIAGPGIQDPSPTQPQPPVKEEEDSQPNKETTPLTPLQPSTSTEQETGKDEPTTIPSK